MPGIATQKFEEKFIKALLPLHKLHTIVGWARFHCENTFISRTTNRQIFNTVIAIILNIAAGVYCYYSFMMKFLDYPLIYVMTLITLVIFEVIIFVFLVKTRLMEGKEVHKFYYNLQLLDYIMQIRENKIMNELIYKGNLIVVIVIIFLYLLTFVLVFFSDSTSGEIAHSFLGPLLINYLMLIMEILNYISILIHFVLRIKYINAIIYNFLEGKTTNNTENIETVNGSKKGCFIELAAAQTHDFEICHTHEYLKELFVACKQFHDIFKFSIFCSQIRILAFCFCIIELCVSREGQNYNKTNPLFLVISLYASPADVITMTLMVAAIQLFFSEIKKTKVLSLKVLMKYTDNDLLRAKAKKMIGLINFETPEFSIYGMWHVCPSTTFQLFMFLSTILISLYGLSV